jgi:hypothetical protein
VLPRGGPFKKGTCQEGEARRADEHGGRKTYRAPAERNRHLHGSSNVASHGAHSVRPESKCSKRHNCQQQKCTSDCSVPSRLRPLRFVAHVLIKIIRGSANTTRFRLPRVRRWLPGRPARFVAHAVILAADSA